MTTDNNVIHHKIGEACLPLVRLMLIGGAGSWKYDFLNGFECFPKRRWLAVRRLRVGLETGYGRDHFNNERFESERNCYEMRCMENASFTLYELGRELPDGLVLILNGMEAPDDDVVRSLTIARRAGIKKLCVFLDWYHDIMQSPDFARLEQESREQATAALRQIGFEGEIPFVSGDSSMLLEPPNKEKKPGGNGTDPLVPLRDTYSSMRYTKHYQGGPGRYGEAVLQMLDAQYPSQPENEPHLRLTELEPVNSARIGGLFRIGKGFIRKSADYLLAVPGRRPCPVSVARLCPATLDTDNRKEWRDIDEAYYDGTTSYAELAFSDGAPARLIKNPPPAAWLTRLPQQLRETQSLRVVFANHHTADFGYQHLELYTGDDIEARVENEPVPARISLVPQEDSRFGRDIFEASLSLERPVLLPPTARISIVSRGKELWQNGAFLGQGLVIDE